jgi:hypothetical protein
LENLCCEAASELVKSADRFLAPTDSSKWSEARLGAYAAEILEDGLSSVASQMSIILLVRWEMGEDYSRRILQDKLHDAIEKGKSHMALRSPRSNVTALTPPELLFKASHRKALARLILENPDSTAEDLFGDFKERYPRLAPSQWNELATFSDACTKIKRVLRKNELLPTPVNRHMSAS